MGDVATIPLFLPFDLQKSHKPIPWQAPQASLFSIADQTAKHREFFRISQAMPIGKWSMRWPAIPAPPSFAWPRDIQAAEPG